MKPIPSLFGIYSSRIVTETGLFNGTILIKDGVISKLIEGKPSQANYPIEDLNDLVVMPGLIDSHVHINEPGRTEWEGFETMTKAAVAGGITTLVDMPLNASPVTTTKVNFEQKLKATEGKLYCDCGFWGGIVPENMNDLDELIREGVLGIKAFLTHSGIDDFPNVSLSDLEQGMEILSTYQVPLLAHAELDEDHPEIAVFKANPTSYMAYLNSRPKIWEDRAVDLLIQLCEKFQSPVHIVHLSSANMLDEIRAAKKKGLPLTVETCPQYLYFAAEDIPDGNTLFKCAPPIRERANNELLWEAVKDGTIDFVVTDHSPATPDLKRIETGNLNEAWGGIASIQFSLPVVWTKARANGINLEELTELMSTKVAEFISFGSQKGKIKVGYDADLLVWNPEEEFVVKAEQIFYRHPISPYVGEKLFGVVKQTYLHGEKVYENGKILSPPIGKILRKQYIRSI